jgi:hypothetical protein
VRLNARKLLGLAMLTVLSVGAFLVTPSLGPGVLPLLLLVALPLSMLLMQPKIPDELRTPPQRAQAERGPTPAAGEPVESEPEADALQADERSSAPSAVKPDQYAPHCGYGISCSPPTSTDPADVPPARRPGWRAVVSSRGAGLEQHSSRPFDTRCTALVSARLSAHAVAMPGRGSANFVAPRPTAAGPQLLLVRPGIVPIIRLVEPARRSLSRSPRSVSREERGRDQARHPRGAGVVR